jgi:glycosyltransferase involved in cell wall biosynthesis
MSRLKIMDFYVHQGHQYEFFKGKHDFYLSGCNSLPPDWNADHRPTHENMTFIDERDALLNHNFDVIMVRSPLNAKRYEAFHKRGATGIAVVQTTDPFPIPGWVPFVVWNSEDVMRRWKGRFPKKQHFYIPHGFDPDEFRDLSLERIGPALSVCNAFRQRAGFLGYDLWKYLSKRSKCKIYGHGNEKMRLDIRECDNFEELINVYNTHKLYLNTTLHSAMPRARAEAMMCGMPLVTTDNYDIGKYVENKKDCILTNDRNKMLKGINKLLKSEEMRAEYGSRSREIAIKHFHIDTYLDRWDEVFKRA